MINMNIMPVEFDAMTDVERLEYQNEISRLEKSAITYDNFDNMLNDMKNHIQITGHTLIPQDLPKQLKFGFIDDVDQSKWFVIKLTAFKKWIDENTVDGELNKKAYVVREAFKSKEGRESLVTSLNQISM